jgi:hypothetical protein
LLISNFWRALVDRSIDPVLRLCHAGGSNPRKHLSRQYNVLSSLSSRQCSERRLVVMLCTKLVRVSRSELKPCSCGAWESWRDWSKNCNTRRAVRAGRCGENCVVLEARSSKSWDGTMLAVGVSDTDASCYLLAALWSDGPAQDSVPGDCVVLEPCAPTRLGSCIHYGK